MHQVQQVSLIQNIYFVQSKYTFAIEMSEAIVNNIQNIGVFYATGISDYKWASEDIFLKSLIYSKQVLLDGGLSEARVLFSIANFYMNSL